MPEILEEKENKLLNRREVKILMGEEKTPSVREALKIVSEKFSLAEENIAVKKVKGSFGSREFVVEAYLYKSKEEKEKIEPKPKIKKPAGEQETQIEEKKPEEKQKEENKKE